MDNQIIDEIKKKYNIYADDSKSVRKKLDDKRKEIHLRSNDAFSLYNEDENTLRELNYAVDNIDEIISSRQTEINIKSADDVIIRNDDISIIQESESRKKELLLLIVKDQISVIGIRYKRQRTPSAVIASVIGVIGPLISFFSPIFGLMKSYYDNYMMTLLIGSIIILFIYFICIIFIKDYFMVMNYEQIETNMLNELTSEKHQNRVFSLFCKRYSDEDNIFSKEDLTEFIQSDIITIYKKQYGDYIRKKSFAEIITCHYEKFKISDSVADSVADVIIERARRKDVIKSHENRNSITDYYEISADFIINQSE